MFAPLLTRRALQREQRAGRGGPAGLGRARAFCVGRCPHQVVSQSNINYTVHLRVFTWRSRQGTVIASTKLTHSE